MRVLRDDNTEVEIMETVDYGDTDLHSIIEGDRYSGREDEEGSLGAYGFGKQEFDGEELIDIDESAEEEDEEEFLDDLDETFDDSEE